jgi:hypothetical protein
VAGIAAVEIVAPVAVAAVAALAALGGVAAEAIFLAYFSAAKMRLASVDNYIVRSEGAPVFAVAVELGFEVASEVVTEVEIGLGPEPEPGAMTADFVSAEVVAVVSVAEDEVFG